MKKLTEKQKLILNQIIDVSKQLLLPFVAIAFALTFFYASAKYANNKMIEIIKDEFKNN